jgi:hypothetical protein
MTRRRRGRRPSEQQEQPDGADRGGQPQVGPDGRPDERRIGYTPPPSPLTRWQHHGTGQRGGPNGGFARPRWAGAGAPGPGGARNERRNAPPPQDRNRGARPTPRPNIDRGAPPRPNPARATAPSPRPSSTTSSHKPAASSHSSIDAFELFCAYHLGITPDDGYRISNIHEVARRFGTNAAELRQILSDFGMAADDIVHSGFDLPGAQVDIMVAPAGISRRELARPLYDEFRTAPKQARNWAREMEEAQRQIDRSIGRDGHWSPGRRDPAGKQS